MGRRVVSASQDRTVSVWDLETGRTLATLEGHTLEGHAAWVHACAVTPDGRRVVSASEDSERGARPGAAASAPA
jgi:WD40 repeat protein